jgi:isopentenyl-diphosphate Delta-isomerase
VQAQGRQVEHVEQVVLPDADRRPVGTMPKIAAQSAHTLLHLAFSVYAFGSDGRFLAWWAGTTTSPWSRLRTAF